MTPDILARVRASTRAALLRLLAVVAFAFVLTRARSTSGSHYLDDDVLVLATSFPVHRPSVLRAFQRPPSSRRAAIHAYYRPLVTASLAIDATRRQGAAQLSSDQRPFACGGGRDTISPPAGRLVSAAVALFRGARVRRPPIPHRGGGLVSRGGPISWRPCLRSRPVILYRSLEPARWGSRVVHLGAWLCALFSKEWRWGCHCCSQHSSCW